MQAIMNWFYFVGQQWLDSLKMFLPKNFKLFVFVTLNAWWKGAKTFFKYFWWLIFVFLFFTNHEYHQMIHGILKTILAEDNALLNFFRETGTHLGFVKFYFSTIMYEINVIGIRLRPWIFLEILPYFLMILAIRPSVKQKTYKYYFSYILQYFIFVFLLSCLAFILRNFLWQPMISFFHPVYQRLFEALTCLYPYENELIMSPFVIFSLFFYLDSAGGFISALKSFWRGLKMIFYNYPFIVLLAVVVEVFQSEVAPYLSFLIPLPLFLGLCIYWLVYIFYFSMLNNFYIKEAHESYEVYF